MPIIHKKIYFLISGILMLAAVFLFIFPNNPARGSIDCCYNECQPTDSPKCDGTWLQKCDKCDSDPYYDWCDQTNCAVSGQICLNGACQAMGVPCAITCATGPGCRFSLANGAAAAGECCSTGDCYDCKPGWSWSGSTCVSICADNDSDGYGNPAAIACAKPKLDCDDSNANINPGKTEICDGADNNCDGQTDEGCDQDNDDYCACGQTFTYGSDLTAVCSGTNTTDATAVANTCDCKDNNAGVHPAAAEICDNGLDDDCDTKIDCADTGCSANAACTGATTCSDNTQTSTCSTATGAPWYCDNAKNLIEKCSSCGCAGSWVCSVAGSYCCDNACNGSCSPAGCTVAKDPDCACLNGNGCCGYGCNNTNDNDCAASCTENWTCAPWSACASGVQTRTCADSNNCGTTNNNPGEEQLCLSVAIINSDGFKVAQDAAPIILQAIASGGNQPYSYIWKDNGTVFGDNQPWQTLNPLTLSIGGHTISAQATDANLSAANDSITIEILPAGSLTAQIQMWQTEFARDPLMPVMFNVQANGGTGLYTFVWNSDKQGDFSTQQWPSIDVSGWALGNHLITVTVTDSNAATAVDSKVIKIVDMAVNMWPQTGENFYSGDIVWLIANVSGGVAPYTYQWSSDKDGIIHTKGPSADTWDNFQKNNLSIGIHTITLTVTDSNSLQVIKTTQIQINPIDPSLVACFNFTDCDDSNSCTNDVCNNPGLMSSSCANSAIVVCQDNDNCCPAGCDISNDNNCAAVNWDDPAKVLVVYNDKCARDDNKNGIKDSYELALYYQQKRGIPDENILPVYPSVGSGGCAYYYYQVVKYSDFYNEIVVPIQNKLTELGKDNINYIMLENLVPKTIYVDAASNATRSIDNALMTLYSLESSSYNQYWLTNPYYESSPTVASDKGHFVHSLYKYGANNMYLVTRIHTAQLIDRALYGEKYIYNEVGYLKGTGYVDTRYGVFTDAYLNTNYATFSDVTPGSYGWVDRCMTYGKMFYQNAAIDYKWEATDKEIGETGAVFTDTASALTAPNALWYEGWYNFGTYHDVFNWLPGAVACDLNSDSGVNFLQKAFNAGLTAGAGVTAEPYVGGHPRPDVFLYYMLNGYNFAESSALSYPAIKWQDIAYGDPLYNPNKTKTKVKDTAAPILRQVLSKTNLTNSDTACDITARIDINSSNPEVAVYKLEYGLDSSYGTAMDFDAIYATEKTFNLSGLTPDTLYHYKVSAKDAAGNLAAGDDKTFKTAPNNTVVPAALTVTANKQIDSAPLTVNFTSNPGAAANLEWNFADGQTGTEQNPTHTFNKGFYNITLTATFANGLTRVAELLIIAK